jgi:hypothetical protein
LHDAGQKETHGLGIGAGAGVSETVPIYAAVQE